MNALRVLLYLSTAIVLGMALSSCSTLIRGTHANVEITSNPKRADVFINSEGVGITPDNFKLSRKNKHKVTLKKPGYDNVTYLIEKEFDPITALLGNIPNGLVPGLLIDLLSGGAYKLTPNEVHVNFRYYSDQTKPDGYGFEITEEN